MEDNDMLNKMKQMYMEWKELVGILAWVAVGTTVLLLMDTAPVIALGIVLVAGGVSLSLVTDE